MIARPLGLLDRAWLGLDSESTPMHVGGLMTFALPDGSQETFIAQLVQEMLAQTDVVAPWNWRLGGGLPHAMTIGWGVDRDFDLTYHVRHLGLPRPGGERELGVLVSRLHSNPLDLRRPPWELYLIEGLSDDRFALYFKVHHALIDGVSAMRLLLRLTTPTPEKNPPPAPWTLSRSSAEPRSSPSRLRGAAGLAGGLVAGSLRTARHLVTDLTEAPGLLMPPRAPRSVLDSPMNHHRRFATQIVDLETVRDAAGASGSTINDVVLHLCGTALRRFLLESHDLPDASLIAAVPMSVRAPNDDRVGTRITMVSVPLGTHLADPRERLQHISEASSHAKTQMRSLHLEGQLAALAATSYPMALAQLSRWTGRLPLTFNLGVSNVPGPEQTRYVAGARMLGLFPASLLMHGGALNITCVSYDGKLDFGFTGARDVLPHLQRLAVHLGEAASELASDFHA